MEAVDSTIIVDVPVAAAYERWSQIETFPQFMRGVAEVRRLDEKQFAWVWEVNGHRLESVSEITLQIPPRRIAWRSVSGRENAGVVAFEEIGEMQTRITMSMKFCPVGEWDSAEAVTERLRASLQSFKALLEASVVKDIVEKNWQGF